MHGTIINTETMEFRYVPHTRIAECIKHHLSQNNPIHVHYENSVLIVTYEHIKYILTLN